MQEVHALCNVEGHLESLLPTQLHLFLLMQKREKGASMTKFSDNQNMPFFTTKNVSFEILPCPHEQYQVRMSYLSEGADLSLEFFECIIRTRREHPKLLDGNISLFICPFIYFGTSTCANLLLYLKVIKFENEEVLSLLELFFQYP